MKRKLLSLLLTLSLALGLAAPALAAEGEEAPVEAVEEAPAVEAAEAEEPAQEVPAETGEPEAPAEWTDLDPDAWYAEAVSYVIENGLMGSTSTEANVFNPGGTVTTAEVYQIIYNMEGRPEKGIKVILDDPDAWYGDAIRWAAAENIYLFHIKTSVEEFVEARAVIRRAYTAAILADYAELKGVTVDTSSKEAPELGDLSGSELGNALEFCYYAGILNGDENGDLNPYGDLTRAELAQVVRNLHEVISAQESAAYTEETVSFEVPETDGIPAHTVPAIVTLPAGEGPFPAVVMLHGTGSDKHEAGMGYDHAAPALAEAGIASIRFDFMGNGESTASYSDYCYTSANLDAKAAADYLAGLEAVDAGKLAVMGWSQGGTNALLAAAAYPETFQAVVTWSGAPTLDGSTLFAEGFDAAYETAQAEGVYTMTFDWRDPLEVGTRWFQEVAETDVLAETAKIAAPVLAINGDLDTTVAPENAEAIAQAAPNGQVLMIQGADHTYNVFTETDFHTILETTAATADFLLEALSGEAEEPAEGVLTGTVTAVSKYGNITTDLAMADVAAAGLETGDVLTVTVGETTLEAPLGTAYSDVDTGSVIVLADTDTDTLAAAINMGNFSETYGAVEGTVLTFALAEKAGYLEEYEIRNIDSLRTNDRADYASDEVFANFRPVVVGDIAEGVLYRSSSPVNPELGRNAYADDLAEAAGIQTVLNLADSQEVMEAYEGYADTYYATLNVVPLDMGVDFAAEDFAAKLKTGLEYLLANEGPYLIHCNEGKDRAGFVSALLEALMGASLDEIVADYMTSYENYYHVEEGSEQYDRIAESNIMASLRMIAGLEAGADLSGTDLRAAAVGYLTKTVGLSAQQVEDLQAVLSGTAAKAAA